MAQSGVNIPFRTRTSVVSSFASNHDGISTLLELVHNSESHGKATNVEWNSVLFMGMPTITVTDDGQGADFEEFSRADEIGKQPEYEPTDGDTSRHGMGIHQTTISIDGVSGITSRCAIAISVVRKKGMYSRRGFLRFTSPTLVTEDGFMSRIYIQFIIHSVVEITTAPSLLRSALDHMARNGLEITKEQLEQVVFEMFPREDSGGFSWIFPEPLNTYRHATAGLKGDKNILFDYERVNSDMPLYDIITTRRNPHGLSNSSRVRFSEYRYDTQGVTALKIRGEEVQLVNRFDAIINTNAYKQDFTFHHEGMEFRYITVPTTKVKNQIFVHTPQGEMVNDEEAMRTIKAMKRYQGVSAIYYENINLRDLPSGTLSHGNGLEKDTICIVRLKNTSVTVNPTKTGLSDNSNAEVTMRTRENFNMYAGFIRTCNHGNLTNPERCAIGMIHRGDFEYTECPKLTDSSKKTMCKKICWVFPEHDVTLSDKDFVRRKNTLISSMAETGDYKKGCKTLRQEREECSTYMRRLSPQDGDGNPRKRKATSQAMEDRRRASFSEDIIQFEEEKVKVLHTMMSQSFKQDYNTSGKITSFAKYKTFKAMYQDSESSDEIVSLAVKEFITQKPTPDLEVSFRHLHETFRNFICGVAKCPLDVCPLEQLRSSGVFSCTGKLRKMLWEKENFVQGKLYQQLRECNPHIYAQVWNSLSDAQISEYNRLKEKRDKLHIYKNENERMRLNYMMQLIVNRKVYELYLTSYTKHVMEIVYKFLDSKGVFTHEEKLGVLGSDFILLPKRLVREEWMEELREHVRSVLYLELDFHMDVCIDKYTIDPVDVFKKRKLCLVLDTLDETPEESDDVKYRNFISFVQELLCNDAMVIKLAKKDLGKDWIFKFHTKKEVWFIRKTKLEEQYVTWGERKGFAVPENFKVSHIPGFQVNFID